MKTQYITVASDTIFSEGIIKYLALGEYEDCVVVDIDAKVISDINGDKTTNIFIWIENED